VRCVKNFTQRTQRNLRKHFSMLAMRAFRALRLAGNGPLHSSATACVNELISDAVSSDVHFSAKFVGNVVSERFVVFLVQLQQTENVTHRDVGVEFPQNFPRVSVSTVRVGGGKSDVGVGVVGYAPQHARGVVGNRLVVPDEVVVHVARLAEFVLRSPVMVEATIRVACHMQNVLDKLLEPHVVSGPQRPGQSAQCSR